MNIFRKITLESLKKNRTRTIVTIIGVILSAAMITGVTTFISSLQNFLMQLEINRVGEWHVEFIDVSYSFVRERENDSELRASAAIQNIREITGVLSSCVCEMGTARIHDKFVVT